MPKKKDEYPEIKDTSRPARDAASMKETIGQSQAEWEAIKARGNPTDEEYEARYQALLKRYNISPDNYKTSKSGAAEYTESTKQESEPVKKETKTPPSKPEQKKEKIKTSPLKLQKKAEKTTPSKATGSPQTSNKSTKIPPKKGYPKGGYKEENQDVEGINGNAVKTMLYNDRVKLKSRNGRPAKESFKPAETTVASIRSEYQKNLIAKHKKEVADIRAGRAVKSTNKKKVATEPTFKTNSLSIANLRNDYQQELIKKRKKEMQK